MNEPINLNRARKARARDEKRGVANANAAKFGRTKAERVIDAARSDSARKMLDQHKLEEE